MRRAPYIPRFFQALEAEPEGLCWSWARANSNLNRVTLALEKQPDRNENGRTKGEIAWWSGDAFLGDDVSSKFRRWEEFHGAPTWKRALNVLSKKPSRLDVAPRVVGPGWPIPLKGFLKSWPLCCLIGCISNLLVVSFKGYRTGIGCGFTGRHVWGH